MRTAARAPAGFIVAASLFAASCALPVPSGTAQPSSPSAVENAIQVLALARVPDSLGGAEYEVILANISDEPVIALSAWLDAAPGDNSFRLEFRFDICDAAPLLPGGCVCRKQLAPEFYSSENTYLLRLKGTLEDRVTFAQEHLIQTGAALPAPASFAMVFRYGCCMEPENELDTLKSTFTVNTAYLPALEVELRLNQAEMNAIYWKIQEINLFSYPDNYSVPAGPGGNISVTPSEKYYLMVDTGSRQKQLFWDDKTRNDNARAKNLTSLIQLIKGIIFSKDAFQALRPGSGSI